MNYLEKLESYRQSNKISLRLEELLRNFFKSARAAIDKNPHQNRETIYTLFSLYLDLIINHQKEIFSCYHQKITAPFNFEKFGIDFFGSFINQTQSKLLGTQSLQEIHTALENGENVILFSNHQSEADPQALFFLLQHTYPLIQERLVFLAGDRVTSDPLSIPFSLGCNLLSVYSKKRIHHPQEQKQKKLLHNQKTMKSAKNLLDRGGVCIYLAPSGGRDRKNDQGELKTADFDHKSIEMFFLMAKKAKVNTSFYPLSLSTHALLPPPQTFDLDLGEDRVTSYTPVGALFGTRIEKELFTHMDRSEKLEKRASFIWEEIEKGRKTVTKEIF